MPRDNETHVLLQSALLESAHMATQASESLSNCLTAYRRHADEGWDPNKEAPEDAVAAHRGSADAVSVAALTQGANESLHSRLVSYHRRVDGGWDPDERFPSDTAADSFRSVDDASVTGSARGSR